MLHPLPCTLPKHQPKVTQGLSQADDSGLNTAPTLLSLSNSLLLAENLCYSLAFLVDIGLYCVRESVLAQTRSSLGLFIACVLQVT